MDAQGKVLIPLDEAQVRAAVARRGRAGRRRRSPSCSCTPTATRRTSSARRRSSRQSYPQLFVTASHELSQEYREFERTSTAAANAYVGPRVRRYLAEMDEHLDDAGFGGNFLIVQSTGGLFDVDEARRACIRMLESGPAAGVIGTKALCDSIGLDERHRLRHGRHHRQGRRDLQRRRADDRQRADRRLCHRPAGADADDRHPGGRHRRRQHRARRGRQRAARRPGKRRRRSPARSATASAAPSRPSPTPIWCSAGSAPTASSAARCSSTSTARRSALTEKIAKPLGLDPIEAADGILRIATTKMAHVVRWVTTERGLDAADFALVAYGGAGPLHAADGRARAAHRQGRHPARAGAFLRLRHAGRRPAARFRQHLVHAAGRGVVRRPWKRSSPRWSGSGRETVARGQIAVAGIAVAALRRHALCRPGARRHRRAAARAVHARRTATASSSASMPCTRRATAIRSPDEKAEIVSLRSAVIGVMRKPPFEHDRQGRGRAATPAAFRGKRPVYFAERPASSTRRPTTAPALQGRQQHRRAGADRGARLDHGACIPATSLEVDAFGDLVIDSPEELTMDAVAESQGQDRRPHRSGRSPKSCATASSP